MNIDKHTTMTEANSDYEVDREDILLLLLDTNQRLLGNKAFKGITRLEKLIFLLAKENGLDSANEHFDFSAYKFGPFSKDVYEAAEFLRGINFVDVKEQSLVSYYATTEEEKLREETSDQDEESTPIAAHEKVYSLTADGKKVAEGLRDIWKRERPQDLERIEDVIRRFAGLPLNQIIRYVYRRYPAMAANSIHPEANKLLLA